MPIQSLQESTEKKKGPETSGPPGANRAAAIAARAQARAQQLADEKYGQTGTQKSSRLYTPFSCLFGHLNYLTPARYAP